LFASDLIVTRGLVAFLGPPKKAVKKTDFLC
jgi:hypothetical protein